MDILLAIIVVAINTTLGFMVYLRDRSALPARLFMVMSLLINVWVIANLITNHNYGYSLIVNDITNRIAFVAGYGIVIAGTVFTYVFPVRWRMEHSERLTLLLLTIPILLLSATELVAGSVHASADGLPEFDAGPLLWLYALGFLSLVALLARNLVISIRKERGIKKRQGMLVLMAFCTSALLGLLLNAILPLVASTWETTRLGPLVVVILVSMVAYSIIRHGLFDVRVAAVRSAAYVLALVTLAGIYYGLAYVTSVVLFGGETSSTVSVSPVNIILALVLAFLFQPVKQVFDRLTDRIFFRNRYDTDDLIARLGAILTSTTHLETLLEKSAIELQAALKASYAVFVVYRSDKSDAVIGTRHSPRFTDDELDDIHELIKTLDDEILIIDGATNSTTERNAHTRLLRMLGRRHVAMLIPLNGHVGYLLLGDALGSGHTHRDIKMLNAVSDELVIAIQNARSVQEIRELNTHLQQRIDRATRELRASNDKLRQLDTTKDEFVSMASHQLRTPLTSIKGYLSMVLEGDMGEINAQQQKVLSEAYSSSERMVRLIGDFLNISRLQTGKFVIDARPTDLAKIIGEEVEAMQRLAESHDMTLVYKQPKKFPVLNLDADKLRQVVMNFIDNAIYYSRPKSTIVVKSYVEHDEVIVEVHDHGIGVPKEQQEQLFTKFFRAENARKQRPDGTGVGLFLARKVVTALGGEIVFSSHEGKGSVFGFRLPIKKLEVKK